MKQIFKMFKGLFTFISLSVIFSLPTLIKNNTNETVNNNYDIALKKDISVINRGLKLIRGDGASVPIGLVGSTVNSNSGVVDIGFTILESQVTTAGSFTFVFDLAPSFGSLASASNNGNAFALNYGLTNSIYLGPSGYNKVMTNNSYGYWHGGVLNSVGAGANAWFSFPFSHASTTSQKGIDVRISFDITNNVVSYLVYGSSGNVLDSFSLPGVLTISSGINYFPSFWIVTANAGSSDYLIFDNLGFYVNQNTVAYASFETDNEICYGWNNGF